MEKQELNLDSPLFKNTIEQQNFIDILSTLNHITPKFITREAFNKKKGNILQRIGNNQHGNKYILYIADTIKIHEFPGVMKKVSGITYNETTSEQSSVNELKHKIEVSYKILLGNLDKLERKKTTLFPLNKYKLQRKIKQTQKAINKFYKIYVSLGGEVNDLYNSKQTIRKNSNNFYDHYSEFNKNQNLTKSSLKRLELAISQEIINHSDEVFFEKGINMLSHGLETFTQVDLLGVEKNKAKTNNKTERNNISTKSIKRERLDLLSQKLRRKLKINLYKQKLRSARVKSNSEQTEQLELEVVSKLLHTLRTEYPYQLTAENDGYQPSKILNSKELYCVGFSLVGHAFMSELGIKHNGLNIPGHSALEVLIGEKKYYFDGAKTGNLWEIVKKDNNTKPTTFTITNKIGEKSFIEVESTGNTETILLSQIYNNRAVDLLNKNKKNQALEMYNKALEKDPKVSYYLSNKASALYELGKFKQASVVIKKSLKHNKNNAFAYYIQGKILQGNLALEAFNTSLRINPSKSYVYKNLSDELLDNGDEYNSGLHKYIYELMENEKITTPSEENDNQKIKLLKLYKQNKFKEIHNILVKNVTEKKILEEGKKYFGQKKYKKSINILLKIPKGSRYSAEAYEYEGLGLTKQAENKLALIAYNKALKTGTQSKVIHYNISKLLQAEGKNKQAQVYEFVDYLINPNSTTHVGKSFKGLEQRKEIVRLYSQGRNIHGINKFLAKQHNL